MTAVLCRSQSFWLPGGSSPTGQRSGAVRERSGLCARVVAGAAVSLSRARVIVEFAFGGGR